MGDREVSEKQMRRRSRTVSWDHSVRCCADGNDGSPCRNVITDKGVQLLPQQGSTSPSLRDSSVIEFFDDNMSISRGHSVEKVRFSASRTHSDENDEDYSASVNAILHKRLSSRKGKHQKQRRSSSPVSSMLPDDASLLSDRRRSSAFTTSSGDTAINIEDAGISQEQIFENIRLHKEVLGSVRQQPWSIRRKMKLVQQAKEYVKKHEGQLQERLAMSKSTRDILARFNILVVKQWQHSKREMANFISQIIPWELTIKEIESQFGTVVASYFTFLRWLFWVNFVISVLLAAFVVMPEVLTTKKADTGERKTLLPEEEATSMELMTLLNFEGVLQHSPMFYGYYSNRQSSDTGYRLPTAYFVTGLVVYIYSFVATLRKMAANSRLSKLSEKDDECIFTWKLFTGWDYMIGNEETAHNRISSIILGFKEALLEEAERMKDKQNWKVVALRIFANLNMVWMLGSSVYAVIFVVARSTEAEAESTLWRKYEITVVMTLIGTFFPIAFEVLGVLESYHPRTTLRVQLARIMALNLLNLYTLTFALFVKINDMTKELLELKPNISDVMVTTALPKVTKSALLVSMALLNATSTTKFPSVGGFVDKPNCHRVIIECPSPMATVPFTSKTTTPMHPPVVTATQSANALPVTDEYPADRLTTIDFVDSDDDGTTVFDLPEYEWTLTPNRNGDYSSETNFENVSDLAISAVVVLNYTSSEYSRTTVSLNYESSSNPSTDSTAESTSDSSTGSNTSPVSTAESILSSSTEVIGSLNTEPMPSSSTEFIVSPSTETSAITTADTSTFDATSESYSTVKVDRQVDEILSSSKRVKRSLEVITNGTHCFLVECSEKMSSVTEVPKSTQTFSEKSSEAYATTTEHEDAPREDLSLHATCLDLPTRRRLRKLCWETMFGQELVKLTVMDLVSTIISTIFVDFARAVFVRYMNRCWCWNLEKRFPQYGDFKIAENILHLVNNQGMVWMGMFFSPGLPIINVVKLMIMMYVRSWAVLTCNVPHDVVFRASRSNNFYLGLLLTMLFLCVLPVGYAIVWIEPSWHCGPFSQYKKIYHIFTNSIKKTVPNPMVHRILDYIASPAIVIPLLLLLILIIYYLASLTSSLREANNDLKTQLRRERTEERRKMFQLVNRKKRGDDEYNCMDTTLAKWRQIMPDNKLPLDGTNFMQGFTEKMQTENEILDRVREKLVHMETDDQEQTDKKWSSRGGSAGVAQQSHLQHRHHHHHHHHHHPSHVNHHRRLSRSDEPRGDAAVLLRKWKKSKAPLSRRPSTESESSDQSEAVPEIRVVKTTEQRADDDEPVDKAHRPPPSLANSLRVVVTSSSTAPAKSAGEPAVADGNVKDDGAGGETVEQPAKQRARLKLAQILYKEARRRRQKYVEELQNPRD